MLHRYNLVIDHCTKNVRECQKKQLFLNGGRTSELCGNVNILILAPSSKIPTSKNTMGIKYPKNR